MVAASHILIFSALNAIVESMSISGPQTVPNRLRTAIDRWRESVRTGESHDGGTDPDEIDSRTVELGPPVIESDLTRWESTHGFRLPSSLKSWLRISDGLTVNGIRWIHPIRCIGPTVRFMPGSWLLQQPTSWYEFGNPHDSPVNMDLIFTTDRDDDATPIFVSEFETEETFRVVADHFAHWLENVIAAGFRPFWSTEPAGDRIDPVALHYARVKPPKLPPKLCLICEQVGNELIQGMNERELMRRHNLNRNEMECLISAFQYRLQKSRKR